MPCDSSGGKCSKAEYPTKEQADKLAHELDELAINNLTVMLMVKAHYKNTKQNPGKLQCICKEGMLTYVMAESNGHFRVKCNKCDIGFVE